MPRAPATTSGASEVFRAGRVDWFAPAVAAAWLAVGLVIGSGTMQLSFAALSAIALYLLASGVLRYRRTLPSRS
jgi:hypothetical protein